MLADLSKIELFKREEALLQRLKVNRAPDGSVHQIDLLEAIIRRIESLESKIKF